MTGWIAIGLLSAVLSVLLVVAGIMGHDTDDREWSEQAEPVYDEGRGSSFRNLE